MNEFREDLRTCLLKCGVENKITTFLFCDAQIVPPGAPEQRGSSRERICVRPRAIADVRSETL